MDVFAGFAGEEFAQMLAYFDEFGCECAECLVPPLRILAHNQRRLRRRARQRPRSWQGSELERVHQGSGLEQNPRLEL